MSTSALALLALALLLGSAAAAPKQGDDPLPSWYRCQCPGRGAAPDCVCPSIEPPGGLARAQTPQFVLFTHDDAVKEETYDVLQAVLGGKESVTGGCQASATLFTLARGTNCSVLQQLYNEGHEVATHSLSHQKMNGWIREEVDDEVAGGRASLATKCGIPVADIQGFRQPFLQASATVREVLAANGFLYDASLLEKPEGESLSRGLAARLWPYSLQDGIAQNCEEWAPFQTCDQRERYHGLFEVPVWDMEPEGLFSEDASARGGKSVYQVLTRIFDAAYEGNRAPVPLFVHGPWLQDNVEDVAQFVDYALAKPGTFFVTVRQLLAWMQNPQPLAQLSGAQLGCGNTGGASGPGLAPPEDEDAEDGSVAVPAPAPQAAEAEGLEQEAAALAAAAAATTEEAAAPAPVPAEAPLVAAAAGEEQPSEQAAAAAKLQSQQPGGSESVQQQGSAAAAAREALESEQPAAAATADTSSSGSSSSGGSGSSGGSSSNLPAIIAGAVGGAVAAIAAIAAAMLLVQRRRRQRTAAEEAAAATSSNGGWINRQGGHGTAEPAAGPDGALKGLKAVAVHAWPDQLDLAEVVEQSGTPSSARRRGKTPFQP
ncbi:polysaccharide deacetylase [Chlorella sorokiniana]|uniref:Polysaccharide deacetylase n=1 Tax=Chlorella sorokiniana TaxID=3076 RepID=A0A2P6THD6_CHLSO|nr:polysaccharide deacetylase [Chlorella sorokiniana]|eukprot:PRW33708.1 polysaccharide deacetylase [Chlorella sorokiniana]